MNAWSKEEINALTNEPTGAWLVQAGDYPDEPDVEVIVLHAVDMDGGDARAQLADTLVAAIEHRVINAPAAPYTGLLETEPGRRLAAAAVLHQPEPDGFCTSCPSTLWPCSTADALSGGIYLAAPAST